MSATCVPPFQCSAECPTCNEQGDCFSAADATTTKYCIRENGVNKVIPDCSQKMESGCACSKSSMEPASVPCYCINALSSGQTLIKDGDFCGFNYHMYNGEVVERCGSAASSRCVCGYVLCASDKCSNDLCSCYTDEDCIGHEYKQFRCTYGYCNQVIDNCAMIPIAVNGELMCLGCSVGYSITDGGKACIPNEQAIPGCKLFGSDMQNPICYECEPGKTAMHGVCYDCIPGCLKCANPGICEFGGCDTSYYLSYEGKCLVCGTITPGCTKCTDGSPAKCTEVDGAAITAADYCKGASYPVAIASGFECHLCPRQCKTCVSETQCTEHSDEGYYLDAYYGWYACDPYCKKCTGFRECQECYPGSLLFGLNGIGFCTNCDSVVPGCTECDISACFMIDYVPIVKPSYCPLGSIFTENSCLTTDKYCYFKCGINCDSCLIEGDCGLGQYCIVLNGKKQVVEPLCAPNAFAPITELFCYCVGSDTKSFTQKGEICDPGVFLPSGTTIPTCTYYDNNCISSSGVICKVPDEARQFCFCLDDSWCFNNQKCTDEKCVYQLPNCDETVFDTNGLTCKKCKSTHVLVDGWCKNCEEDLFPECKECASYDICLTPNECPFDHFHTNYEYCIRCPAHCEYCADYACIVCEEGYYLEGYECKSCSNSVLLGCKSCEADPNTHLLTCLDSKSEESPLCWISSYLDRNEMVCKQCPDGCYNCESEQKCTACKAGYTLTSISDDYSFACVSNCGKGCETCIGKTCTQCKKGYWLRGNECRYCKDVIKNCAVCDYGICFKTIDKPIFVAGCGDAMPPFVGVNGFCQQPKSQCNVYSDLLTLECGECVSGAVLFPGTCANCMDYIDGCGACELTMNYPTCTSTYNTCPEKTVGVKQEDGIWHCTSCGLKCNKCDIIEGKIECSECNKGYYLKKGECFACETMHFNCTSCTETRCLEISGRPAINCAFGFWYNSVANYCFKCYDIFPECVHCTGKDICLTKRTAKGLVGFKPDECPNGFAEYSYTCVRCSENCVRCEAPMVCSKCAPYYYVKDNVCASCSFLFEGCSSCTNDACLENAGVALAGPESCPSDYSFYYNYDYNGQAACYKDTPCKENETVLTECSCVKYQDVSSTSICVKSNDQLVAIRLCSLGESNSGSTCVCRNPSTKVYTIIENGDFCDYNGSYIETNCQYDVYLQKECKCFGQPCVQKYCKKMQFTGQPLCRDKCQAGSDAGDCFCGDNYVEDRRQCFDDRLIQCKENVELKVGCVCDVAGYAALEQHANDCGLRNGQFCKYGQCYNHENHVDDCSVSSDCQLAIEQCVDQKCRRPCVEAGQTQCVCGGYFLGSGEKCNGNGGVLCSNSDGTEALLYSCACSEISGQPACAKGKFCAKQQCSARGQIQMYDACTHDMQCSLDKSRCMQQVCLPECTSSGQGRCYCGDMEINGAVDLCDNGAVVSVCVANTQSPSKCNCGGVLCYDNCQEVRGERKCVWCEKGQTLEGFDCIKQKNKTTVVIIAVVAVVVCLGIAAGVAVYVVLQRRRHPQRKAEAEAKTRAPNAAKRAQNQDEDSMDVANFSGMDDEIMD